MPRVIPPPLREDRGYATPCLIWQGRPSAQGYARITENGVTKAAHVVIWEREHGPLPPGHELDHLCYQRMCVELSHLECVTKAENRSRAGIRMMGAMAPAERSRQSRERWKARIVNGNGPDLERRERMRRRRARGETYAAIAASEGCAIMTAWNAINGHG
jgi:hypothetical protein